MKKALIALAATSMLALAPTVTAGIDPVGLVYAPKDCTTPKIEPHRISFTCADDSVLARHIEWSDWGGEKAKGTGALFVNDCDPNCADGTFHSYGAKVKLLKIKTGICAGQTVDLYQRAHIRFIGEVPPHARNLQDFKLFCNE